MARTMERRGHGTGQVTHVACRKCDVPVRLDAAKMDAHADPVTLRCEACGALVPVRRSDPERDSWRMDFQPRPGLLLGRIRRIV
jgi:hypothetical protein